MDECPAPHMQVSENPGHKFSANCCLMNSCIFITLNVMSGCGTRPTLWYDDSQRYSHDGEWVKEIGESDPQIRQFFAQD